jgi:Protein of unknown function (DUF2630)
MLDLVRQRRALREFGEDPDKAKVRPAKILENYEQQAFRTWENGMSKGIGRNQRDNAFHSGGRIRDPTFRSKEISVL